MTIFTAVLCWITEEGNEWMNETVQLDASSPESCKEIAISYVNRTKDRAAHMVESWRRNGEAGVTLEPFTDCRNYTVGAMMDHYMEEAR